MKKTFLKTPQIKKPPARTAFSTALPALMALVLLPSFGGCSKDKADGADKAQKKQKNRSRTPKGAAAQASRTGGPKMSGGKGVTKALIATWIQPSKPKAASSPSPDPGRKKLFRYKLSYGPKIYTPDNLYELLNGGADLYVKAGLVDLAHFRLKPQKGPGAECRVSMFFMKSAKNAQSLLAKEKAPGMKKAQMGDASWSDKEGALVQKGRVLVRLESVAPGPDVAPCPFGALAKAMVATKTAGWTKP